MTMRSGSFLNLGPHGFHRVAYTEWGDRDNPQIVICMHGLTRNGRDFDALAQSLAHERRVICPDVPGRGESEWLAHAEDYNYPVYLAAAAALIARVTAPGAGGETGTIDWVGTSMGGLIGMLLAAQPNSPIRRLVLNDVGPFIPKESLRRIAMYVGKDPRFQSMQELESYIRTVSAPFGPLTDAQWRHLSVHSARRLDDGSFGLRYDPGIGIPFSTGPLEDVDLWPAYDAIRCPTLLLRGAQSDLLLPATAAEMTRRGPRPELVEFAGVGHAPMLMADDQIDAVRRFLLH
jgi:pimeloyl-ACP methyl ester carboxylesterase